MCRFLGPIHYRRWIFGCSGVAQLPDSPVALVWVITGLQWPGCPPLWERGAWRTRRWPSCSSKKTRRSSSPTCERSAMAASAPSTLYVDPRTSHSSRTIRGQKFADVLIRDQLNTDESESVNTESTQDARWSWGDQLRHSKFVSLSD